MAIKRTRLEMLRNLLQTNRFESQEEVLNALREQGFKLAQPTLSRDLRTLKVSKVCTEDGGYAYILPEANEPEPKAQDIPYGFKSVDFIGNFAIVKTASTYANSLAIEIDRLNIKEILGTVAGYDTLIVIMREDAPKSVVIDALKKLLPNYEE